MSYNFTAQWVKGTLSNAPDALSRNSVTDSKPHEALPEWYTNKTPERTLTEIRATAHANQKIVWLQARDFCSYAAQDYLWPNIVHMGHNTITP